MKIYLPDNDYLSFIRMLEGHEIYQNVLNQMLGEMAKEEYERDFFDVVQRC